MGHTLDNYASELFLRISEEKQDRILGAAVLEFAAYGYAGANVNRIARSAGISVGALYKYFDTKNCLFLYIVEISAQQIEEYVSGILTEDIRLLSKLEKLLRLAQTYAKEDPSLIKMYNVFTSENEDQRAAVIAGRIESITAKAYNQLIAGAQEKGEIRDDIDAGVLAFMLDNQLMNMQFSSACGYYSKRFSLFLGEKNAKDNEYVINSMMKVLQAMLGIR